MAQFVDVDVAWTPADLVNADHEKANRFKALLMNEGVFIAGGNRWFISPNHTEVDINKALAAAHNAMANL